MRFPFATLSARSIGYVGLLSTNTVLVAGAALALQLFHSGLTAQTVAIALLLAVLHTGALAWWLSRRLSAPSTGATAFFQAWFFGTTAFPLGGLPGAIAMMNDRRPLAGVSLLLITAFVIAASLTLGAVFAGWVVLLMARVSEAESKRARDGKQLVVLTLNIGWTALACTVLLCKGWLGAASSPQSELPLEGALASIARCVAVAAGVVVGLILRNRSQQKKWLQALASAEDEDEAGANPQFVIERLGCFPDAEHIPPYLSNSLGRYTGVLVRTDQTSGTREILGRVR